MQFPSQNENGREEEERNDVNTYYVCDGTCGAKLTEEEYEHHKTKKCGDINCTHHGQPFVHKEIPTRRY